jgi:hypothetical protein
MLHGCICTQRKARCDQSQSTANRATAGLVSLEVVADAEDEVMCVVVCRHIKPISSQEITVA